MLKHLKCDNLMIILLYFKLYISKCFKSTYRKHSINLKLTTYQCKYTNLLLESTTRTSSLPKKLNITREFVIWPELH